MRVCVTGGRAYSDHQRVRDVLDKLHAEAGIDVLIEGGANGADKIAKTWALLNKVAVSEFEADWEHQGNFAGPARNQRMLTEGKPDVLIAFNGGKGTADCVKKARKIGIEVVEIAP